MWNKRGIVSLFVCRCSVTIFSSVVTACVVRLNLTVTVLLFNLQWASACDAWALPQLVYVGGMFNWLSTWNWTV